MREKRNGRYKAKMRTIVCVDRQTKRAVLFTSREGRKSGSTRIGTETMRIPFWLAGLDNCLQGIRVSTEDVKSEGGFAGHGAKPAGCINYRCAACPTDYPASDALQKLLCEREEGPWEIGRVPTTISTLPCRIGSSSLEQFL